MKALRDRLVLLIFVTLLAACTANTPAPTAVPPEPAGDAPLATVTPPAQPEGLESGADDDLIFDPDEGYPALATAQPVPEEYPAPTAVSPPNGYDDAVAEEFAWVLFPVGEQCAEPEESVYQDLNEAITALAAAGVPVNDSEMTDLMVCEACGCPTSAHYRVQIDGNFVATAVSMGWVVEEAAGGR